MPLTGRGGYGNFIRAKDAQELEPVPSTPAPVQHFTSPKQTFRAGRGGYGNNVPITRMPVLTPQEYLQEVHQALDVEPERYSVGRGGAGNIVSKKTKRSGSEGSMSYSTQIPTPPESPTLSPVTSMPQENELRRTFSQSLWSKLKTTLSH
jgi:hypothetical protein